MCALPKPPWPGLLVSATKEAPASSHQLSMSVPPSSGCHGRTARFQLAPSPHLCLTLLRVTTPAITRFHSHHQFLPAGRLPSALTCHVSHLQEQRRPPPLLTTGPPTTAANCSAPCGPLPTSPSRSANGVMYQTSKYCHDMEVARCPVQCVLPSYFGHSNTSWQRARRDEKLPEAQWCHCSLALRVLPSVASRPRGCEAHARVGRKSSHLPLTRAVTLPPAPLLRPVALGRAVPGKQCAGAGSWQSRPSLTGHPG